ncbi:hypothetical protein FB451DRAFT_1168103 [Mycena latifolia]|nr:hypothetical protein FB451DRAFT_1168103 [Mycena latifolia]
MHIPPSTPMPMRRRLDNTTMRNYDDSEGRWDCGGWKQRWRVADAKAETNAHVQICALHIRSACRTTLQRRLTSRSPILARCRIQRLYRGPRTSAYFRRGTAGEAEPHGGLRAIRTPLQGKRRLVILLSSREPRTPGRFQRFSLPSGRTQTYVWITVSLARGFGSQRMDQNRAGDYARLCCWSPLVIQLGCLRPGGNILGGISTSFCIPPWTVNLPDCAHSFPNPHSQTRPEPFLIKVIYNV